MMARLRQWREDIIRTLPDVSYDIVYVDEGALKNSLSRHSRN